MMANLYIVEDHPFMQRMLCDFLNRLPEIAVCGVAKSAEVALLQLPTKQVDLVLADVALPDMNGIELVRVLQEQPSAPPCLIFSSYEELSYVQQAVAAGACGYLFKGHPDELATAIKDVLDGQEYWSCQRNEP